ncbi:MAG: Fur family transcriptional regulator [Nitrospirales bacterium]|nr:MAG: Fur family transcriptional regulator [Nitrospirales bacterium]
MLDAKTIAAKLEEAGVQATAQRIAIYQYIVCEADHPTAEEIKDWADQNFPKMSLATVYNTLNILVAAGLLKDYRFPNMSKVIYDSNVVHHHHFLDDETGQLIDIDPDVVEVTSKLKKEFHISQIQILFRGTRQTVRK